MNLLTTLGKAIVDALSFSNVNSLGDLRAKLAQLPDAGAALAGQESKPRATGQGAGTAAARGREPR